MVKDRERATGAGRKTVGGESGVGGPSVARVGREQVAMTLAARGGVLLLKNSHRHITITTCLL
jgi:hypothetical protein